MAVLYNYCKYNEGRYQSESWDVTCDDFREDPGFDPNWDCGVEEEQTWNCTEPEGGDQTWEPIVKRDVTYGDTDV